MYGSLALGLAPGGDFEGVNKDNEGVLFTDMIPSSRFRAERRLHKSWRPQS